MFEKVKDDFFSFLRFQSVSTDPSYAEELLLCASWLEDYLQGCGLKVEKWDTAEAPVIFASNLDAGPDKQTLLFYTHYDVQPPDPLSQWHSAPFAPEVREGKVFARGASDDKGQCFYTLVALKHYFQKHGAFPLNIKFLIEGGEECGSNGLAGIVQSKRRELKADHLLIVDMGMQSLEQPQITFGTRGLLAFELLFEEGRFDLHSGVFGGAAYNPNLALVELLAKFHDPSGRVAVPGFYDEVSTPPPGEVAALDTHFDLKSFEKSFGFSPKGRERGVDPLSSIWFRPTLEINGICGGYSGIGVKTVIPAKAVAKITCRLVPKQKPERIYALLHDFVKNNSPTAIKVEMKRVGGSGVGFRCKLDSPLATIMTQSYSEIFHKPCKKVFSGGSIPIAPMLAEVAGAETLLVGTALESDLIHSPNEHFAIASFEKGYETITRMLELFAQIS